MAISVLGPLLVTVEDRVVPLPARQRTLLAILAFQANRTVPADRLVEAIWGEDTSPTVLKTLQSHIFQLRRSLTRAGDLSVDAPRITTDPDGYRLQVNPRAIDARVFLGLLEAAGADGVTARSAADLLTSALRMWRGPGLADVGDDPAARAEVRQLEDLRLSAIERLAESRLALGEHEALVPWLRRAVGEAPYNERLWTCLMTALVRSGRRAEALIAYRHARDALWAELEIEPGRDLQELARRIREEEPPGSPPAGQRPGSSGLAPAPTPLDATVHAC